MTSTRTQVSKNERRDLSWLLNQSRELKLDIIQNHLSICQMMLNEIFEEEVIEKAGKRYSHDKPKEGRYSRYGFNPGSVQIGDQTNRSASKRSFARIEHERL